MAGGEELTECAGSYSLTSLMDEETLEGSCHPSFQCCVCLDLLFKPVVLACGHMSCFWCVHKAMHGLRASYCAICRHPYLHFPNICEALHMLVLKMEPVAYKRREKEVLEEEKRLDVFSPQFSTSAGQDISSSDITTVGDSLENPPKSQSDISKETHLSKDGIISKDDLLCTLCQDLLFQPTVLNCGHVFCMPCLTRICREPLTCPACHGVHPGEFPKVCLDLDSFLEEQFPIEYKTRTERLQQAEKLKHPCGEPLPSVSCEPQTKTSSVMSKDGHLSLNQDLSKVNVGVGCDSCGMYPIIGKRYKCKDCKEAIGFDLCESCYNTDSKLPGRFNQQHTSDHQFELDESHILYRILLRSSSSVEDSYLVFSDFSSADELDQNGPVSINRNDDVGTDNDRDNRNI